MTSIDTVISKISKHKGLQDVNRYRVVLPSMHIGDDVITMDTLCREVTVPGKTLNLFSKRENMKEIKTPHGFSVDSVNMRFNETNDNLITRYFDFWMNTIVSNYDYLVEYRDYYARNVLIFKMDRQDKITYGILLKKAYPSSKQAVNLTDTTGNTFVEQSVTFEYQTYEEIDHTLTGALNQVISRTRANVLGVPLSNAINIGRTVKNIII